MTRPVIRDAAMPGLARATRGEIVPRLYAALRAASNGEWKLDRAEPIKLRYQAGKRAVVQYAVTLSGPGGEMRTEAALWFYAGGKAAKVAKRTATAANSAYVPPAAVLEPVTGGVLQIFPHDHRVPEIARFLASPEDHASVLFSEPVEAFEAPELARFRPGIGATFRWRGASGRSIYVKINAGADPAALHARDLALHRAGPGAGFATPRPAGAAPAIAATSLEAVEGSTFAAILTRSVPEIEAAVRRVARALTGFHACSAETGKTRDHDIQAKRAARAASLIGVLCARSGSLARDIAGWIARTQAPLKPCLAHADVKPEHLILTDEAVTLVDLDSAALFDGLYDIAMLEIRILSALAAGACDQAQAEAAIGALRDAYPSPPPRGRTERYRWLKACAAMQVALHHAQNPAPGWRRRLATLLEHGRPNADAPS